MRIRTRDGFLRDRLRWHDREVLIRLRRHGDLEVARWADGNLARWREEHSDAHREEQVAIAIAAAAYLRGLSVDGACSALGTEGQRDAKTDSRALSRGYFEDSRAQLDRYFRRCRSPRFFRALAEILERRGIPAPSRPSDLFKAFRREMKRGRRR